MTPCSVGPVLLIRTREPLGCRTKRLNVREDSASSCQNELHGPHICITCRDQATPALIRELLPGGMAMVDRDGELESISLELCDATVGETVLTHAGVAIAKLTHRP